MGQFIKLDLFQDGTLSPKIKETPVCKIQDFDQKSKERTGGRNIENPILLLGYVN